MRHIDFDALDSNVRFFRERAKGAKLCAVLKNDAYGHGTIHIANHLAPLVDCFAVGDVVDAEALQYLGKDTLILLPLSLREVKRAIAANAIVTVDSFETLFGVDCAARSLGKRAKVHVKFDSGMSRLGFDVGSAPAVADRLRQAFVDVEGVFSHFYGESVQTCDEQLARFLCAERVFRRMYPNVTAHIANTCGCLLSPKYHLDMVRIGLGLYGYGVPQLRPVKTVTATVIACRKVAQGSAVGYGAIFCPNRDTNIAVLNVGYAQGLPRMLVGEKISINGRFYPIVAVCMAMTMVDLGDDWAQIGQEAVLLGKEVNLSNSKVFIYELLCNLQ